MSQAALPPHLRLIGTDDPEVVANWARSRLNRQQVIRENRAAGLNRSLDPTDPRWVLAIRAYSQLQGTTLTPERRQRVMRTARQLGIRPFDANLIVAIVQDHARSGLALSEAQGTLTLLREPEAARAGRWAILLRWAAAIATAAVANALLIRWFLSS
ncbi:MAG: hypothetical protein JSV91_04860 [Phycisphaerales bacterium]|nr:MAG: hypothetical protein JSV91_04860 [Phycisphaerales bacterium]